MKMATYEIEHLTCYRYQQDVTGSHHAALLRPAALPDQQVEDFSLEINPPPRDLRERRDSFGNAFHLWSIDAPHGELTVHSTSRVTVTRAAPDLSALSLPCADARAHLAAPSTPLEVRQYRFPSLRLPHSRAVTQFAEPLFPDEAPLLAAVQRLNETIFRDFEFDADATSAETTTDAFLKGKRGVCQDFTHLMVSALRSAGFAARYVSGYILTHPKDGEERLIGADASHAWVSVYEPNFGWVDFDPTNNLLVGNEHITVAWGRDFSDVSMVRGAVRGGGAHELEVAVSVIPEAEAA